MRVLAVGDLHAYPWGVFPLTPQGDNQYLAQVKDLIRVQLPRVIRQHSVDLVVFLGDLADEPYRRGKIGVNTQNILIQGLRRLRDETHTRVAVIAGNHDCYSDTASWIPALADVISFGAAGEPLMMANDIVGGPSLCFVPYANPAVVNHWLSLLPDGCLVFGHFAFQGASMAGKVIEDEAAVPLDHLMRFRYAVLGHIHHRQDRTRHSYVGLPIPYSWGNKQQGELLLIDTAADPLKFDRIPMHYPMFAGPAYPGQLASSGGLERLTEGSFVRVYSKKSAMAAKEQLVDEYGLDSSCKVFPTSEVAKIAPEEGKSETPRSKITGAVVSAATTVESKGDVLAAYVAARVKNNMQIPCDATELVAVGRACLGVVEAVDATD